MIDDFVSSFNHKQTNFYFLKVSFNHISHFYLSFIGYRDTDIEVIREVFFLLGNSISKF